MIHGIASILLMALNQRILNRSMMAKINKTKHAIVIPKTTTSVKDRKGTKEETVLIAFP